MTALFNQPHAEVRRLLATGAPVFLPVNPVEYHGPHLSLHNDRLISEAIARDLHARFAPEHPFLLAADLEVGVDPCSGPGTRHTSYLAVRRAVLAACDSLIQLGAQAVFLVTFHGSPLHGWALQAGVARLQKAGVVAAAPFSAVTDQLLVGDASAHARVFDHVTDPAERAAAIEGLAFDFHAGFFETSLALHYAPASVDSMYQSLPACPTPKADWLLAGAARLAALVGAQTLAAELRFAAVGAGWYAMRPFLAYSNRPHLATAEAGAWLAAQVVEQEAAVIEAAYARQPTPKPMMGWLRWATVGGRLFAPTVPLSKVQNASD